MLHIFWFDIIVFIILGAVAEKMVFSSLDILLYFGSFLLHYIRRYVVGIEFSSSNYYAKITSDVSLEFRVILSNQHIDWTNNNCIAVS